MDVRRINLNIKSDNLEQSRDFYTDLLGLTVGMDLGWIITFVSPSMTAATARIDEGLIVGSIMMLPLSCACPSVFPRLMSPSRHGVR